MPEGRHPAPVTEPLPFFAGSSYLTFDLGHMPAVGSAPDDLMSLVIGIETLSSYDDGSAIIDAIYAVLPGDGLRDFRHVFWMWFNQLVKPDAGDAEFLGFEEMERLHETGELRTLVQDRFRAWREADREQGRAEGRLEGVEQGRAEGAAHERMLLRRQAGRKFGVETAERLSALLAGIEDPDRLAQIGDGIIDCVSGAELIRRLEDISRSGAP